MADQPSKEQVYFLGVDGGGTKCRAVLVGANQAVLGTGEGGPSNPYHGVARAMESISNAIQHALKDAGLAPEDTHRLVVGLGLAGVNVPSVFKTVEQWDFPYLATYLTTDLHIACIGAHESADGAVMVAGTGSCGFAHVNGESLIVGAHGFPCGDKGSGAWLGLSAVQAVLLADDTLGPSTILTELICEQLQARNGIMIVERLSGAKQSDYARLAPLVFHAAQSGDAVATAILKEGAEYLDNVARKLWARNPGRMAMIGGVAHKMTEWMDADLVTRLSAPLQQPEYGAVLFAQNAYAQQQRTAKEA